MGRGFGQTALAAALSCSMGCAEYIHHDWEPVPDEKLAVLPEPRILVNGWGHLTVADGCTDAQDHACENDFGFTTTGIDVGGALVKSEVSINTFYAGPDTGPGTLHVNAKSNEGKDMVGDAVVEVVLPDGANVYPMCSSDKDATAPYLVPRATNILVGWSFTLDGTPRSGWTGEVPVDAPDLALAAQRDTSATYLTPDAAGPGRIVRSTMGDSSFKYDVYDPADAVPVLELMTYDPYTSVNWYALYAEVGGRRVCDRPAMTVTTSTPEICALIGANERVTSISPSPFGFPLLPLAAGMCELTISIDGTDVAQAREIMVAPKPTKPLSSFDECTVGGKTCTARCEFVGCMGPCCYEYVGLDCTDGAQCTYKLTPDSPDTCTVEPRAPVEGNCP